MSELRCYKGRLWRHDPQFDDPDLETDVGECPDCSGGGCVEARQLALCAAALRARAHA